MLFKPDGSVTPSPSIGNYTEGPASGFGGMEPLTTAQSIQGDRGVQMYTINGNDLLAGLGIKLHLADIAKVRAVGQPQLSSGGVQENSRVDGIAVPHSVRWP